MKIAFVHDWIVTIWWAEKVLQDLIQEETFSQAEIFCIFGNKSYFKVNEKEIKINPVISNNFIINKIWYRNLMPIFPLLAWMLSRKIKKYNPEKIVISSFAVAKNIYATKNIQTSCPLKKFFCKNNKAKPYTKLYLHSPMQYIRSSYDEYINKLSIIKKNIYKIVAKYLRIWDKKFNKFDEVYFNSQYTAQVANDIYWIRWEIKHPKLRQIFIQTPVKTSFEKYYIYVWRLVSFSREVDKVIQLFNENNEHLIIVWSWPDEIELKVKAKWKIIFVWQIKDDAKKINLLQWSSWLINITKESFGIITAESLSLWVPVLWYNDWATPELVDENSWILVNNKTIEELKEWFLKFQNANFDRQQIKENFLAKIGF